LDGFKAGYGTVSLPPHCGIPRGRHYHPPPLSPIPPLQTLV
jgi:hypothetical protein